MGQQRLCIVHSWEAELYSQTNRPPETFSPIHGNHPTQIHIGGMIRNMQQLVGTLGNAIILPPVCWFYLLIPNVASIPSLTATWTVLETPAEVYCLQYVFKCTKTLALQHQAWTLGCPSCTKTCNLEKSETQFRQVVAGWIPTPRCLLLDKQGGNKGVCVCVCVCVRVSAHVHAHACYDLCETH